VSAKNNFGCPLITIIYTIAEDTIPANFTFGSYSIDEDTGTAGAQITVTSGATVNLVVSNRQTPATITVVKDVVAPDGTTDVSDNHIFSITLNNQTKPVAEGAPNTWTVNPGSYSATETIDADYELVSITPNPATVGSGGSATITVVNKQKTAQISGYKYEDSDANLTTDTDRQAVSGWWVELWRAISGDYNNLEKVTEAQTGADGKYTFTNVIPGFYRIIEILGTGWHNLTNFVIDLFVGSNANIENNNFINYEDGQITAYKYNDLNGNGTKDTDEPVLSGWDMTIGTTTQPTGSDGSTTFAGLAPGSYTVTETLKSGWTNTTATSQNVTISSGESETVYFGNFENVTITVEKNIVAPDGTTDVNDPNTGFEVTLYDASGAIIGSQPISEGTNAVFGNLGPGTYTLVETSIPGDPDVYTLVGYSRDDGDEAPGAQITVSSGTPVMVIVTNRQHPGKIIVNKVDSAGNPIPNTAGFTLFTEDGAKVVKPEELVGVDGKCTFDNLDWATYIVRETKTPPGYNGAADQTVTIDASNTEETIEVTFVNTPIIPSRGTIEIQKVPAVSGVGFTLFDATGTKVVVAEKLTGTDGKVKFSDLEYGTYIVRETKGISGYSTAPDQKVTIDSSNVTTVISLTFTNTLITGGSTPTVTPTVAVAGVIEVAGLAFTGVDPIIPVFGLGIFIVGLILVMLSLRRRKPLNCSKR
jgi:uncharacterized surface anchored protein